MSRFESVFGPWKVFTLTNTGPTIKTAPNKVVSITQIGPHVVEEGRAPL